MKNLHVFNHVSTAYVNCNMPSGTVVKELVYDLDMDVEQKVGELMKLNPEYCKNNLESLITDHPNTYCFTKWLTEKMLVKRRGNLKMVISRPSIVCSSLREPYRGWSDTLAAAGSLTTLVAAGLINYLPVKDPEIKFDIIPVDIVSNSILITSAYAD